VVNGVIAPEGKGRWIEYAVGGQTIAIASIGSDDWVPSDQGTSVALEMEDFDQAIRELQEAGVKFAMDAMESPVCHMAVVQDPDGNKVVIHERKATS
jgi:predicted enzyme related to lactoylglutathione lyase